MAVLNQLYIKTLKVIFGKHYSTSDATIEAEFLAYFQNATGITTSLAGTTIYQFILADTTLGDYDADLPEASLWSSKLIIVKADELTDANVVNVIPNGSETIDGEASFIINTLYGAVTLYSDGTNIHVVNFI